MKSTVGYRLFINVSPAAAFAYISDLSRHSEWSGAPLTVEALDPGPVAVGKRYRSVGGDAFSQHVENQLTVTEYTPSTRFCFAAIDPRMRADAAVHPFVHEFMLTPQAGGTWVKRNVIREMPFIQHLLTKYVMGNLVARPLMNRALAALKRNLENTLKGPQ